MEEVRQFLELYEAGLVSGDDIDAVLEWYVLYHSRTSVCRRLVYDQFDITNLSDEDVFLNFRFKRNDLPRLFAALRIPQNLTVSIQEAPNRLTGLTALCILLRRFSDPNRLSDLERFFGMSGPAIEAVTRYLVSWINRRYSRLLEDLQNLHWLDEDRLRYYAKAIRARGAPLPTCWGFVDGTTRRIRNPTVSQGDNYSGHQRFRCLKYQAISTPDGLVVNIKGPFNGRRHDAGIWRDTDSADMVRRLCQAPSEKFVLYGDQSYGITDVLITPFSRNETESAQDVDPDKRRSAKLFNERMSTVLQAAEGAFEKVVRDFPFLDFSQSKRLELQDMTSMYKVGVILSNCHTCLYGCPTSEFFRTAPVTVEQYLVESNAIVSNNE